ncbi:MAG: response regulator transcription factor [Chloroflexi bacterium]|nr:response regulator transcription factor [Chloroflexota bacterium]
MIRIFIVTSHPLFGEGVERLLRQKVEVNIVGRASTVEGALQSLGALRPDVVIWESECPACRLTPAVSSILQEGAVSRVIALNLQNNTMCIYSGERKEVTGTEDLFEAMEPVRPPTADTSSGG